MTIAALDEPAKAIDSSALFVDVEALLGLEELRDCSAGVGVVLEL